MDELEIVYQKVSEAVEIMEELVELDVYGKPTDKGLHHILDHLGWAESLLADELKKLNDEERNNS